MKNVTTIIAVAILAFWLSKKDPLKSEETKTSYVPRTEISPLNIKDIKSFVFRFSCEVYVDGKYQAGWRSHCIIYANHKDVTYIAIPSHCFISEHGKEYKLAIFDSLGEKIELDWLEYITSDTYDAKILVVKRLKLPAFSNIASFGTKNTGGSAVLVSPFNERGIYKKTGFFSERNSVIFDTFFSEPGDSGAVVLAEDGVVGISFSISDNGKEANFVAIDVFENLYLEQVRKKK